MKRLTCQEVLDQLSDYLDEEAHAELVHEVDQHLGSCSHCRVEVDSIRQTIRIFRCDTPVVLPVALSEKLQHALARAYQDGPASEGDA